MRAMAQDAPLDTDQIATPGDETPGEKLGRAADAGAHGAGLDADLIRAIREEVVSYGVRRATAASIAARAGVHRVTLYRRGGGIRRLILDSLETVFTTIASEQYAAASGSNGREFAADLTGRLIEALRAEPLFMAVVDHDPDLLLPYVVDRLGGSQQVIIAQLTPAIERGIADGSVRACEAERMARVIVHACTPFVIGGRCLGELADPAEARIEVRDLVEGYLRPPASK
ncbi:hypothetical protein [Gephyromycinifex aptenodytis]|uniref:hypothetical protein n=1 Tax=Gephyromycinifex aptenodytis TaxID=2716227 RepID=UPI001B2FFE26|nr:hypothetical protein [Gephyromycinifex aptenodytis]